MSENTAVPASGSAVEEKNDIDDSKGFGEGGFGEKPKESPAKDLREIQALIVNGIFPGNVAPQVIKAFQLLETMAAQVERDASKVA